jgi:hypothetical protein
MVLLCQIKGKTPANNALTLIFENFNNFVKLFFNFW